ncbi:MAG: MBL fold metallo-hydrolase [Synechococcaceae cyanobacterium SM2_3_1]|nr:MBL fold metallo-hydrolase [Synechococcaceae cyanobacterium SM2_3_1]
MKRRWLIQGLGLTLGSSLVAARSGSSVLAQEAPPALPTTPPVTDPLNPLPPPPTPTTSPDAGTADPTTVEFVAPTGGLRINWLHHSCVLFESPEARILVNPFRSIGCTAGYPPPALSADLVLLSSRLFDEGFLQVVPGNPRVLFQPGDYTVESIRIQGVRMAHDNTTSQGNRFGINVGWRWEQAGIDIVHLGGAAAPITREQEILLSKPDILFIPVGGGPKNYDPEGAKEAIATLNPKVVVPTMYRTAAADSSCELQELEAFLSLFPAAAVQEAPGVSLVLSEGNLPDTGVVLLVFPD